MYPSPEIGTVKIYKSLGLFEAFEQCRGSPAPFLQEVECILGQREKMTSCVE